MRTLIALLAVVSLCVAEPLAAKGSARDSSSEPLTLDAAIAAAFAHNRRLRAGLYRAESARGRADQAKAWPNPRLTLSSEDIPSGGSLSDGKTLIGLEQSIPFPAKQSSQGSIGRWEVAEGEAESDLSHVGLRREVTIAFLGALAAETRLSVSREILTLTSALAEGTAKRVAAGAAPYQEQLRAELELERVRSDLQALESGRVAAREALFVCLGESASDIPLAGDLAADSVFVRPDSADASPADLHPALAGAAARRGRAEEEYRRARLELLPDFDIRFAAGRDESDNDVYEIEAGFSVPIFDRAGGLRREKRAALEAARYDLEAAQTEFEASRRKTEAVLGTALARALAYRDRILPRSDEALALVRGGFDAGKFGFIDLLDTQRTAAEARLAYVDALLELNAIRAELSALNARAKPAPKE